MPNDNQISFVDVKEYYDAAYEEFNAPNGTIERFQALIHKAEKLDQLYRQQIANTTPFSYRRAA